MLTESESRERDLRWLKDYQHERFPDGTIYVSTPLREFPKLIAAGRRSMTEFGLVHLEVEVHRHDRRVQLGFLAQSPRSLLRQVCVRREFHGVVLSRYIRTEHAEILTAVHGGLSVTEVRFLMEGLTLLVPASTSRRYELRLPRMGSSSFVSDGTLIHDLKNVRIGAYEPSSDMLFAVAWKTPGLLAQTSAHFVEVGGVPKMDDVSNWQMLDIGLLTSSMMQFGQVARSGPNGMYLHLPLGKHDRTGDLIWEIGSDTCHPNDRACRPAAAELPLESFCDEQGRIFKMTPLAGGGAISFIPANAVGFFPAYQRALAV
ncbi:hypothetical protein KBA73_02080 [Patescibacteria group bacterium]|nr:hypothetical protein [Patescibacteria group bacterium]